MTEIPTGEGSILSPAREQLFRKAERELYFPADIYRLGERFGELPPKFANTIVLDVTRISGCHYGAKNVFVPIIRNLEEHGVDITKKQHVPVSPDKTTLIEPSTGNGWVALADAARMLGYEYVVIMPDGLPEARYRHPDGEPVKIIRTPAEDYANGMPKALQALLNQNPRRLRNGEKIYVTPDHAVRGADITIQTMSELGRQVITYLGEPHGRIRIFASMGNGSSLCAIGGYLKRHSGAKVIATESFAYGGGYDRFAKDRSSPSYKELYGMEPDSPHLMAKFSAYGTNVRFDKELPLQERAFRSGLIDSYELFSDAEVMTVYEELGPSENFLRNAVSLPNRDQLPRDLYEVYGNSTLGNFVVASQYIDEDEVEEGEYENIVVAYDGRKNY